MTLFRTPMSDRQSREVGDDRQYTKQWWSRCFSTSPLHSLLLCCTEALFLLWQAEQSFGCPLVIHVPNLCELGYVHSVPLCENSHNLRRGEQYGISVIMKLFKQKPMTPKHTKTLTRLLSNPWTSKGLTSNASFFLSGMNWFCHQQTKCNQALDLNHKLYWSHS